MKHSNNLVRSVRKFVSQHTPEILTGLGTAGMVATAVFAVKATPKALKLLEEKKKELNTNKLTATEVIKTTWKCYVPAAVTCVTSAACIIGSNSVHNRRHAALAAAYKLSETALTEYREKVIETLGEKEEKKVHEALMKDKVDRNPVSSSEVVVTGKGDTLCCESQCERYFKSSRDEIVRCINEVNRKMNRDGCVSLNDLYGELGLWPNKIGDTIGWNADWGLIEPRFSTQLADDHKTPCLVLDYYIQPKAGYDR